MAKVNYTYADGWKDRLTNYNGEAITYDAIGNPLTYRGYTLTWQKGRQLKSIENSSYDLDFKYNADGLRTEKKVNGITYSYIWSSGLLMQFSGNGHTLKFGYSPDGRVLSVNYNGSDYYYVYNLQGDVIALHNHVGTVVVEYTYDSWGRILSTTGSQANGIGLTNPFRYRGYLYDGETGLYYVSSRYYDPEIGRFISPDTTDVLTATPMGLTDKNLYAYCDNNPVVRVDHGGQFWDTIFDVVSLCVSVVNVIKDPSDAMAWVGLAADVVSLAVPFATGGGAIVKAATKADDVVDAVKTVNKVDDVIDTTKTAKKTVKVHGNSLKSTKTNYGYALVDRDNNIMKFGETVNPKTRYSQKYLNQNGYSMKILESGSKADIHYWQYDMNMYYKSRYGSFPPLNKRGW